MIISSAVMRKALVIKVSQNSTQYINPMDINLNYSEGDTPIALKSDFIDVYKRQPLYRCSPACSDNAAT